MRDFQEHIEATSDGGLDAIEGGLDASDFYEPGVRDAINFTLSDITDGLIADPVIAYERVRDVIADAGYLLPPSSSLLNLFLEPDGDGVFALVSQSHPLAIDEPEVDYRSGIIPCYFYFAFCQDEAGYYDILAEVVTQDELEEILNGEDAETV